MGKVWTCRQGQALKFLGAWPGVDRMPAKFLYPRKKKLSESSKWEHHASQRQVRLKLPKTPLMRWSAA